MVGPLERKITNKNGRHPIHSESAKYQERRNCDKRHRIWYTQRSRSDSSRSRPVDAGGAVAPGHGGEVGSGVGYVPAGFEQGFEFPWGHSCPFCYVSRGFRPPARSGVPRHQAQDQGARRRPADPDLKPHDLRHAFCERLQEAGVPLRVIQELAGHDSVETTQVYVGVTGDHPEGAIRRMETAGASPVGRVGEMPQPVPPAG